MNIEISPGINVYISETEFSLLNKVLLSSNYAATDGDIFTLKSLLAKSLIKRTRKAGVTSYAIRPEIYHKIAKFF